MVFKVTLRLTEDRVSTKAHATTSAAITANWIRLNIGSVRHYFGGHDELIGFAMQSMLERVSARLHAHMSMSCERHHLAMNAVLYPELVSATPRAALRGYIDQCTAR